MEKQTKGVILLIVVGIIWFFILKLTTDYKTLFVEETGKISLFGRDTYLLFMLGLFFRQDWLRKLLVLIFVLLPVFIWMSMVLMANGTHQYGTHRYFWYTLLIIACLLIAGILNNSDAVKAYFRKR